MKKALITGITGLINFLNAVISFKNNQKIKSLEIVDPYNIPMLKGMKDTYVDVKAVLDNDCHVRYLQNTKISCFFLPL